jgi:hypothetical protein
MLFKVLFSLLLASLLATLVNVEALPVKRGTGMITIPLKRLQARGDIHPQIVSVLQELPLSPFYSWPIPQLLQQHINRAHRRLARMAGTVGPSDEELAASLHKRMSSLPREAHTNAKRYYRVDPPSAPNSAL